MNELAKKRCIPCEGGVPPLEARTAEELSHHLEEGWHIIDGHHLHRDYHFGNFSEALDFANRIGEVANRENHHPDLHVAWGKVGVDIWTHKIDGLTESDFILAAKIDNMNGNEG